MCIRDSCQRRDHAAKWLRNLCTPYIKRTGQDVYKRQTLDDAIKTIDWGNKIVKQEDVDSIAQKVKAIRETIVKELDADHKDVYKRQVSSHFKRTT